MAATTKTGAADASTALFQRDTDAITLGWYITFSGQPSAATAILKPMAQK